MRNGILYFYNTPFTKTMSLLFAAFQALVVLGDIKANDNVLVHAGASGVGLSAIQLARLYGAYVFFQYKIRHHSNFVLRKTVTATASTEEKLTFLTSLPFGATHTANYKTQDFSEEVKKTTAGKGVDVIIDFVGKSHWQKNIDSLAVDGRMTMLALLSGKQTHNIDLVEPVPRDFFVFGVGVPICLYVWGYTVIILAIPILEFPIQFTRPFPSASPQRGLCIITLGCTYQRHQISRRRFDVQTSTRMDIASVTA